MMEDMIEVPRKDWDAMLGVCKMMARVSPPIPNLSPIERLKEGIKGRESRWKLASIYPNDADEWVIKMRRTENPHNYLPFHYFQDCDLAVVLVRAYEYCSKH